jgi:hypothetical protein
MAVHPTGFLPGKPIMLVLGMVAASVVWRAGAQSSTFAGNAQHTSIYSAPAQSLNQLHWSTSINLQNTGDFAHYGGPLITPANTVLVPVKKNTTGFQVTAFEGATGRLKHTYGTDYILPSYSTWVPVYQPVIATPLSGARLYYAGAGGTVYYVENPDSDTPGTPVHQCFYTNLAGYTSNAEVFNVSVFINTPLTAATNGVVFFGFRVQGTAPAPLNTTQSGFARLDPDGNAIYVLAGTAAGTNLISRDSHSCAPALSNDGSTLYVAVKNSFDTFCYLLGLDSTTLATKYKALLQDPRNGSSITVSDISTASPLVGPDGDVFFGVLTNPNDSIRGFLLHFSADLQTQKLPSGFGWDHTPAVVPTNMVPCYTGTSSYLLFSKYNNYAGGTDGDGINRIALLDPNVAQTDAHPRSANLAEMREVLTVIGCTPDSQGSSFPYAVREWCINTAAVNPPTMSVFAPSEDGRLFRWNLAANSLTEAFTLGNGVSAPYVPTAIGPDGTVYTLNGTKLFALGSLTNETMTVYSSDPDLRGFVAGQPVTFTAVVTNLDAAGPVPTGTVTFQDVTYQGFTRVTTILGAAVPLTNGIAAVTNSTLSAGSNALGNHFITAIYSGDATFPTDRATLVQKVHIRATSTTPHFATGPSNTMILSATVASLPPATNTPTGMVSFWDGSLFLAQAPLDTNTIASFTTTNLTVGSHAISATYASDTFFASSSGNLAPTPPYLTGVTMLNNGAFQLAFSNSIGAPFTVLGSTELGLPLSNWSVLGPATEILPGQFLFTDPQATNSAQGFYRVRSP